MTPLSFPSTRMPQEKEQFEQGDSFAASRSLFIPIGSPGGGVEAL